MVKIVGERLGLVDTLVLNAYIGVPMLPLIQASSEHVEAKVTGELKAAFYALKALAPEMLKRKRGWRSDARSGQTDGCGHDAAGTLCST